VWATWRCGRYSKWLDLGEGHTFLDPKWWSLPSTSNTSYHVFAGADGAYRKTPKDRLPVLFEAGSIVAAFEKEQYLAFDLLLTQERVDEMPAMLN
jgi:hypothetical protein